MKYLNNVKLIYFWNDDCPEAQIYNHSILLKCLGSAQAAYLLAAADPTSGINEDSNNY